MAQITRSTKVAGGTTLGANTLARAADVETDVLTLFSAHNNHDSGTSQWSVVNGALVEANNGTAGSPSLTFVNDPDTGLYRDAANTVGISAGGTKRMGISDTAATLNVPTTLSAALTMSGAGIAMGSQKITGLASGTVATDAAAYTQVKVLQVVFGTTSSQTSTTSNGFTITNLTASITPTSTSNKVLVLACGDCQIANVSTSMFLTLFGGTGPANLGNAQGLATVLGNATNTQRVPVSLSYLDSPSSTSALTYSVRIRNGDNTTTVTFPSSNTPTCSMILMEVNGL
jgi:hypothetical protein